MSTPDTVLADRYALLQLLGEGATGSVYRARDLSSGESVAVKVLHSDLDAASLRREFDLLSGLSHPGVVKVKEIYDGFLVMPLVEGIPLGSCKDWGLQKKTQAAVQLLEILQYVHSHGVVHGDLKPSNILVRKESGAEAGPPELVLTDFGLARLIRASEPDAPSMSGTLAYLPPEVIRLGIAEARSDLYAVGIILYELLCSVSIADDRCWQGEAPGGTPAHRMLLRHLQGELAPPSTLRAELPAFWDRVLLKLVRKDVEERYRDAEDVLEDLTLSAGMEPYKRTERVEYGVEYLRPPNFVGREQELQLLMGFLLEPVEGTSAAGDEKLQIAFVMGRPGSGRTRLVQEAQRRLFEYSLSSSEASCRFVWGRCRNPHVGLHVISDILSASFRSISSRRPELASEIACSSARQMLQLAPELGVHPLLRPFAAAVEPQPEDVRETGKFFLDYMLRIASAERLALVIDDADLIDPRSAAILEHLARLIPGEPIKIIAICGERETAPVFEFAWDKGLKLSLPRLSPPQCVLILDSIFGRSIPRWQLDESLIRLSRGNPLHLWQLVCKLAEEKVVYRKNGLWEISSADLSQIPLPSSVSDEQHSAFLELPPLGREILSKLAVAKFWTPVGLLKKLLQILPVASGYDTPPSDAALSSAFDMLVRDGFLFERAGAYIVASETFRAKLYSLVPEKLRRELHATILKELERQPPKEEQESYQVLAYHHLAVGNDKKGLACLVESAKRLKRKYDYRQAEAEYRRAAALVDRASASMEVRIELLVELAQINAAEGDLAEAQRLYEAALALEPPRTLRAEVLYRLAELHAELGDLAYAAELAQKSRVLTSLSEVERNVAILNLLASICERDGDLKTALGLLDEALRMIRTTSNPATRLDVLLSLALVQSSQGQWDRAMDYLNVAFKIVNESKDPYLEAKTCAVAGRIHYDRADTAKAAEFHSRSVRKLEESGHFVAISAESNNLGLAYHERGNYSDALHHYLKALKMAQSFGELDGLENLYANLGLLHLDLGQVDRAEEANRRGLALARSRSRRSSIATHLAIFSRIQARRGQKIKALDALHQALDICEDLPRGSSLLQCLYRICQAYLEQGELDKAEPILVRAHELADETNSPRLRGIISKLRGIVASRRGAFEDAAAFLNSAIRTLDRVDSPKELGEAYLELGSLLLDNSYRFPEGESLWDQGHQALDKALESFASIGFQPGIQQTQQVRDLHVERSGLTRLKELEEERKKLLRLQEINKALNSELELRKLLEKIMDAVLELVRAERGFLLLMEEGKITIEVARNIDQESISKAEQKFSHSIAQKVVETGSPIISTDALEDDRFSDFISVHNLKLRSVCCIPLVKRDKIIGAFYIDNRFQTGAFTQKDVELLQTFAHQAGVAIENARLYEELLQKQKELQRAKEVQEILNRKLEERLQQEQVLLQSTREELDAAYRELELKYDYSAIVAQSEKMREVFRLLDRVTDTDVPVLIQGERGTGKELIARAIHFNGPRKRRPFVAENCSAFPQELLESELFGHVRGAFTGATADKKGLFEIADGGTLFLDEIGDMSLEMQAKLLRVIEEGVIRPVGGQRTKRVNVRLISASNRDLQSLVAEQAFRADLLDRLSIITVQLPPLRERKEDIPLLVEHFLRNAARGSEKPPKRLRPDALAKLLSYTFPGNVRQLENMLKRAALLCPHDEISLEYLNIPTTPEPVAAPFSGMSLKEYLDFHTRAYLEQVLKEAPSKTEAAQRLGIERTTLYKLLKKHNLEE